MSGRIDYTPLLSLGDGKSIRNSGINYLSTGMLVKTKTDSYLWKIELNL